MQCLRDCPTQRPGPSRCASYPTPRHSPLLPIPANDSVETAAPRTGPRSACHPPQCVRAARDDPDAARTVETAQPPALRPPAPDQPASPHFRESQKLARSPLADTNPIPDALRDANRRTAQAAPKTPLVPRWTVALPRPLIEPPKLNRPKALRVDSWRISSILLPIPTEGPLAPPTRTKTRRTGTRKETSHLQEIIATARIGNGRPTCRHRWFMKRRMSCRSVTLFLGSRVG